MHSSPPASFLAAHQRMSRQPKQQLSEAERRVAIGKADLAGSCQVGATKHCGGKSSGNCWCDASCDKFGDCCADKKSVCDQPAGAGMQYPR